MRKFTIRAAIGLSVAASALVLPIFTGTATAGHIACHVTHDIAAGGLYFEDRADTDPVPGVASGDGTWVYQESNNLTGLQHKAGQQSIILDDSDVETCTRPATFTGSPDSLIL